MREEKRDPILDRNLSQLEEKEKETSNPSSLPRETSSDPIDTEKEKEKIRQEIKQELKQELLTEEKQSTTIIPLVSSVGECNIPTYFATDGAAIERCNEGMAVTLFKAALVINTCFSLLFFKNLSTTFMLGFVIFHIFLYFFTTRLLVAISIGEWKTFQAYKLAVKRDPDFSRFDTPISQFRAITDFLLQQPINKQKMIYLILIVSFLFVWLPLMFNVGMGAGESRFNLEEVRKKLPI